MGRCKMETLVGHNMQLKLIYKYLPIEILNNSEAQFPTYLFTKET